jgi:hypothetical protein
MPSVGDYDVPPNPEYGQAAAYSPHTYSPDPTQLPMTPQATAPTSYPNYGIEYVSPAAWQDAVASSFGARTKRRWDLSDDKH